MAAAAREGWQAARRAGPPPGRGRRSEAYPAAGGIEEAKAPLFQSVDGAGRLSGRPLARRAVLAMIKRRASAAGLPASTCCHTFRATGITAYLSNGGTLEHAQRIAGHASPKTTKLYDSRSTRSNASFDLRLDREQCVGFVVAVLASIVVAAPAVVLADGRVALVVGNSTYALIGRLPNPGNDEADMTAALR